jgi:hypothetical protein
MANIMGFPGGFSAFSSFDAIHFSSILISRSDMNLPTPGFSPNLLQNIGVMYYEYKNYT